MLEQSLGCKAPRSARVVAFEREGRILGVAGLYLDEYRYVMFGNFGDEVRRSPRALVKAYRSLLGAIQGKGLLVHATPDEGVPAAERFLEHMGFRRHPAGYFELEA